MLTLVGDHHGTRLPHHELGGGTEGLRPQDTEMLSQAATESTMEPKNE